jgi:hypothetical protein
MKKFFKDYSEYQKNRNELCKIWYKNHWKGTVVFNTIALIIMLTWMFWGSIKKYITKLFSKNIIEEEEA